MAHEGQDDREALRESLLNMIQEREIQMELKGLSPTRDEVLDAVWNTLVRGKARVRLSGVSEEKIESDLLILCDLIEELREPVGPREQRGEGDIEFLKSMRPLISSGIDKRVRRQLIEEGKVSPRRAIDEEEADALANLDAVRAVTPYPDTELERRKEILRIYFQGLRNNLEGH